MVILLANEGLVQSFENVTHEHDVTVTHERDVTVTKCMTHKTMLSVTQIRPNFNDVNKKFEIQKMFNFTIVLKSKLAHFRVLKIYIF